MPTRAVPAAGTLEFQHRPDPLELAVAILIGQPVQGQAFRALSRRKQFAVQAQQPAAVLELIAGDADLIDQTVAIGVVDQHHAALLARRHDVPKLVERHGQQRTRGIAVQHLLDDELLVVLRCGLGRRGFRSGIGTRRRSGIRRRSRVGSSRQRRGGFGQRAQFPGFRLAADGRRCRVIGGRRGIGWRRAVGAGQRRGLACWRSAAEH